MNKFVSKRDGTFRPWMGAGRSSTERIEHATDPISCDRPIPIASVQIAGGNWSLVRRVAAGDAWHSARDNLAGFDSYGVCSADLLSPSTFSIPFANVAFDQFLFATGDEKIWLIAEASQVQQPTLADKEEEGSADKFKSRKKHKRQRGLLGFPYRFPQYEAKILSSSTRQSPHVAVWHLRENITETRWITLGDYDAPHSIRNGTVYGERRQRGPRGQILHEHGGANVFIRNSD
eukprot:gene7782-9247_t